MLEEIRDTNGNFIRYEYTKDQGQIYPEQIIYTGNGSSDGLFGVEFALDSREDQLQQYNTGFEVRTCYRVSSITTYDDVNWLREYDLGYEYGENGNLSLLSSVTESGRSADGSITVLPSTEFNYSGAPTWSDVSSSYSRIGGGFFSSGINPYALDTGGRMMDVNGDALPDFVLSIVGYDYTSPSVVVYKNTGIESTGGGVTEDSAYKIPVSFMKQDSHEDQGVRFADMNGDGFIDILKYDSENKMSDNGVYINDGEGNWNLDTAYSIPLYFIERSPLSHISRDSGVRLFDINGDGFADLVYSMENYNSHTGSLTLESTVYVNKADGTGWELDEGYEVPVGFISYDPDNGGADRGVRIADFNGDGLLDLVKDYASEDSSSYCALYHICIQNGVYVNKGDGTGWELTTTASVFPRSFVSKDRYGLPIDDGTRIFDINGDGLDDVVCSTTSEDSSFSSSYLFGAGSFVWTEDTSYEIPISFQDSSRRGDYGARMEDLNGDGVVDFISSGPEEYSVYWSESGPAAMLEGIQLSTGGSINIEYKGSAEYKNSDSELQNRIPFVVQTVYQVTTSDGLGSESTVTYDYEDGKYYYADEFDRQFAGFGTITKTESARITKTYYLQDERAEIGQVYKTEIYDAYGNLYSQTVDTWATKDLGYDNDYVYKTQTATLTYDGGSGHRDSGSAYTYDSYGNTKTVTSYGEVDANEDGTFTDIADTDEKFTITYSYATDASGKIRGKVSEERVKNASGGLLKCTRYLYDSLAYGSVSVGNLTRKAMWDDVASAWNSFCYAYSSYGLITKSTNPRGYSTSYTYDSYNLYPSVTKNAKSYTVATSYYLASGQVTSRTDENGATSKTTYDGFGRILTVSVPDPSTGVLTTLSTSVYDDISTPSSVPSEHSFTDKELDDDLGLYYFEARWYDSEIGRFSSEDPAQYGDLSRIIADPQSLNFYAYSRNNPVRLVDPTGESANPFTWDWGNIGSNLLQTFDTVPGFGDLSDVYSCVFGKTLFTQTELTDEELGLTAIMGILPVVTGGQVRMGSELANMMEQSGKMWSKGEVGDSVQNLVGHFEKHGEEVGAKTAQEYYDKAMNFISDTSNKVFQGDRDTTVYYNSDSNLRAITNNSNGEIKTFHELGDPGKIQEYNSY